jgi:hypothetical protein
VEIIRLPLSYKNKTQLIFSTSLFFIERVAHDIMNKGVTLVSSIKAAWTKHSKSKWNVSETSRCNELIGYRSRFTLIMKLRVPKLA